MPVGRHTALRDLAGLHEVTIRIPEDAPDLSAPIDWRRQEDRALRLERLEGCTAVWHADRQLMADGIGIARRRKGDGRLVRGRAATGYQEQPAPLEREHARGAAVLRGRLWHPAHRGRNAAR